MNRARAICKLVSSGSAMCELVSEGEKQNEAENVVEEIVAEFSPNLKKNIFAYPRRSSHSKQDKCKSNKQKTTDRHTIVKELKTEGKGKKLGITRGGKIYIVYTLYRGLHFQE